jgi:hypothetical protein
LPGDAAHEITADNINALVAEACGRLEGIQPFELVFQPAEVLWEGMAHRSPGRAGEHIAQGIARRHCDRLRHRSACPVQTTRCCGRTSGALPWEPVAVEIDQVALITVRREGRRYVWSPVDVARLW